MNFAHSIHHYVKRKLDQQSKTDGRLWVTLVLTSYFSLLYLSNFFVPYQKIWKILGIPVMTPLFADLRGVLAGFECTRFGYDVLYQLPCDLWNRGSLVYPRLWMKLEWLGLNQSHSNFLGILMAISFYWATLVIIGKLNNFEALVYVLILCSPPIMLLIERANVDIIIYVLLFLSLVIVSSKTLIIRFLGYLTLLLPIFLKLLPIFSLSIILKEKKKNFIFYFSLLSTISIVYFLSISEDLKAIKAFFIVATWYSFGYRILLEAIGKIHFSHNHFDSRKNIVFALIILLCVVFLLILIFKILSRLLREFKEWLNHDLVSKDIESGNEASTCLDSFRMGSSLYLGTFVVTVVYDYKLAFLIFSIPQIIFWIKYDSKLGMPSSIALLGIIITLYFSPFLYPWLVDEIINWFLWGYFLYTFALTLPAWIKIPIHSIARKVLI